MDQGNLLIKNIYSTNERIGYELKIFDINREGIKISYLKNESRYTDDGYTLYALTVIRKEKGLGDITPEIHNELSQIADRFGVILLNDEFTVLKGNDVPHHDHYEMANLVYCIVSINSLITFTNLFG